MNSQNAATLLVTVGSGHSLFMKHPVSQGRVDTVDMYGLADVALQNYKALLLTMHSDQRYLFQQGSLLEAFLGNGGIIVFSGHVAYPFLPELQPFVAFDHQGVQDLQVNRASEHPIWQDVHEVDLTFRKGVAGFYGRGINPPPPGTTIINTLGSGQLPLDYIYTRPGGGTVLIHSGIDFWTFGLFPKDDTSAAKMAPQLLDWIENDSTGGQS